jgi:phospholipid/cholesterol/gamma-HCH transport system substrate-binding protein
VHARFVDASQLVRGALVEVGGRTVGRVRAIDLADDNEADVVLDLTAAEVQPLRRGTVAAVRAVGLSGVTNRFVELTPGPPGAPAIPDGGTLSTDATRPMVDLDAVLNALDPATRRRLQRVIAGSAEVFDGTAQDANAALGALDPAVAQLRALAAETARDTAAVGRLVTTGAAVARTLAVHGDAVEGGITGTARSLRALATQRRALGDALRRTPAVLHQANGTLGRVDAALREVRPALRELRPVAGPLAAVLRRLAPVARDGVPALRELNALLPALRSAAAGLPALDRAAQPALRSTTRVLRSSLPVFTGLRQYAPDALHGLVLGVGGTTASGYDANGHYARISPLTEVPDPSGVALKLQTGNDARCPGGAADPAPDGSTPWIPDASLCDPEDDVG